MTDTENGNAVRKCVKTTDMMIGILKGSRKGKLKITQRVANTAINGRNDSYRKEDLIWAQSQKNLRYDSVKR